MSTAGPTQKNSHPCINSGQKVTAGKKFITACLFETSTVTQGEGLSTMINRGQFVCAASAALFARISKASAAAYDLLIKGGRVIDPSVGLDAIRDLAIAGGRIASVEADITGDATQTIDARGKIVAP